MDDIPLMDVIVINIDDDNKKQFIDNYNKNKNKHNNKHNQIDSDNNGHDNNGHNKKVNCFSVVWMKLYRYFCNACCLCNILWILISISLVVWALSEAGLYGEGILRTKNLGEMCGSDIKRLCSPGLRCIHQVCEKTPENVTWVVEECDSPPAPPAQNCPPQVIQKSVSYFDYREYPNMYLRPQPDEVEMSIIPDIDYGACKEICSRNKKCHAICYYSTDRGCHMRSTEGISPPTDGSGLWTCAIKT